MVKKAAKKAKPAKSPESVDIFYDESPQYRIVYSDGAWASITPNLELQVVFFKNLAPTPEYVRQAVKEDGSLGEELERVVKQGISREYEVTVVMNKNVAREVLSLLTRLADQADKAEAEAKKKP